MEEKSKGIIVSETIDTNEESRITDTFAEKKKFPYGLVISVILSAFSAAIITWLILSIVISTYNPFISWNQEIYFENFFLQIIYSEEISPGLWMNRIIKYKIGFYILLPIAMISFAISGLTILVKDYKQTKLLIFLNWGIYLTSTISSIFINGYNTPVYWFGHFDIFSIPTIIFAVYFMINIFFQISLLSFEEDFYQWILSPRGPNKIDSANNPRVIIFFILYLLAWFSPLILMFSNNYGLTFMAIFGIGLCLLTIWWSVGDSIRLIILMNKNTQELEKNAQLTFSILSIIGGIYVTVIESINLFSTNAFIPIRYILSFTLLIIGTGFGALSSKSIIGKIGYALNTLCLLAFIIIPFIVTIGIMGWENLLG